MSGSLDRDRVEIIDDQDADAGVLMYPDGRCRILTNRPYPWVAAQLRDVADSLDLGLTMVEQQTADPKDCDGVEERGTQFAGSAATILTVVIYVDGRRRVLANRNTAWSAARVRRLAAAILGTDS